MHPRLLETKGLPIHLEVLRAWSSQECSRPCQGRGRGFKSLRPRRVGVLPLIVQNQ
jgi:hypothetical protein